MTSPPRVLRAADGGRIELEAIVAALSDQYAVMTGPQQLFQRALLDTFDRRLAAAGFTLEHRRMASGEQLVLGRSDAGPTVTGPVTAPVKDLRWPALVDGLPAGPIRDAVAAVAGIRALLVISDEKRRVRRLDLRNEDGKTVARIDLDQPASTTQRPAERPAELAVLPLRGYEGQGRRTARLLLGLGLRAVEPGEDRGDGATPRTVSMDRGGPARVLLTDALSGFLATMRENLPGLLADVDTEFLHDFRVAVRRTRSTLKLGRPDLPEVMRSRWEPSFKWLGDITTPVRDLDVHELDLPTMRGWLVAADPMDLEPFSTHLQSHRTASHRELVRALRSVKFRRLLTEWEAELAGLTVIPDEADREHVSAGQLADSSISLAYRRVARAGAAITNDSPAVDLHALRKRCKELRYALEVFAPVLAPDPRRRAVADLKGLQNVLGRFQDTAVQRDALRGFAAEMMAEGSTAETLLAMGELIGHLDADQNRARGEFDGAFERFTRPSGRQLMHRLGGGR